VIDTVWVNDVGIFREKKGIVFEIFAHNQKGSIWVINNEFDRILSSSKIGDIE